ncbi:MAG: hypothetical protein GX663_07630 [Clostridiales bacterium]|nr:hypothetical protein [Clostridiales bacterium]
MSNREIVYGSGKLFKCMCSDFTGPVVILILIDVIAFAPTLDSHSTWLSLLNKVALVL